jgi:hypothetical protein
MDSIYADAIKAHIITEMSNAAGLNTAVFGKLWVCPATLTCDPLMKTFPQLSKGTEPEQTGTDI